MGTIALMLEEMGIPTSFVVFEEHELTYLAQAGAKGYGWLPAAAVPAEAAMDEEEAFAAGVRVGEQVLAGLTSDQPAYLRRAGDSWVPEPEVLTVTGTSYEQALDAFNDLFLRNRWGDGLPLVPPTQERVNWLLTGTDLEPETVIGKMGPSFGALTVHKLAVNAAMAGARPEHMPVIIAAMKAITSYPYDYYSHLLRGVTPLVIVHGPIVDQLGVNHAGSETGANPLYPAGTAIGRAINLAMRNIGGFGLGVLPAAQHGHPAQVTGLVIGESKAPTSWTPLAQELGLPEGANAVTVLGIGGTVAASGRTAEHAASFVPPNLMYWPTTRVAWQRRITGVLLVTPFQARRFALDGITKEDIKQTLYQYARVPRDEFERIWEVDEVEPTGLIAWLLRTTPAGEPIPIAARPENFLVIAAGGWDSSMSSGWLLTDSFMSVPATQTVELPADWEKLVDQP